MELILASDIIIIDPERFQNCPENNIVTIVITIRFGFNPVFPINLSAIRWGVFQEYDVTGKFSDIIMYCLNNISIIRALKFKDTPFNVVIMN